MAVIKRNGRVIMEDLTSDEADTFAGVLAYEHAERIYPLSWKYQVHMNVWAMSVTYDLQTSNGSLVRYEAEG
jgi:hypothetical protein